MRFMTSRSVCEWTEQDCVSRAASLILYRPPGVQWRSVKGHWLYVCSHHEVEHARRQGLPHMVHIPGWDSTPSRRQRREEGR